MCRKKLESYEHVSLHGTSVSQANNKHTPNFAHKQFIFTHLYIYNYHSFRHVYFEHYKRRLHGRLLLQQLTSNGYV